MDRLITPSEKREELRLRFTVGMNAYHVLSHFLGLFQRNAQRFGAHQWSGGVRHVLFGGVPLNQVLAVGAATEGRHYYELLVQFGQKLLPIARHNEMRIPFPFGLLVEIVVNL